MDLAQAFILDLGWVFLAAWGMVLAAVCAIAFGWELFAPDEAENAAPEGVVEEDGRLRYA